MIELAERSSNEQNAHCIEVYRPHFPTQFVSIPVNSDTRGIRL
jgi:hypothetical protein